MMDKEKRRDVYVKTHNGLELSCATQDATGDTTPGVR